MKFCDSHHSITGMQLEGTKNKRAIEKNQIAC